MKRDILFIALACFLGALIGAWSALEISTLYAWSYGLWPVGALIGGLVGYLAYDPRGLWRGVRRAWTEVSAWQPDFVPLQAFFIAVATVFFLFWCWVAFFSVPWLLSPPWVFTDQTVNSLKVLLSLSLLIGTIAGLAAGHGVAEDREKGRDPITEVRKGVEFLLIKMNPLGVTLHIVRGLWWSFVHIPHGTKITWRFLTVVFRYVHSDLRTLCLVDASIGAAAGFYLGNPLVGGLVGALVGVLNYLLVSVWWLELVPHRSR